MRILLAGDEHFRQGLLRPLEGESIEVIGHADEGDEAARLIDSLQPDVVLVEPRLMGEVRRRSSSAAIVVLSPPRDEPAGTQSEVEAHLWVLDVLETALALASATPLSGPRSG